MSRGFPDGAWLVLLDSVRDPLLVTQAVFSALGVHDLSSGLSLSSLADYLAGKRLLLVLDNCEHLLDACAVLASTLIAACPDLHVLATSRQALGVAGEVRMVVPPMSLPAEGDDTSVQQLLGYDAVWLLSERAAAVVPGFTVDAANAEQVLALCRKLDGIPLALELAAVRLGSLSLEQLNQGLASELSILGTGQPRCRGPPADAGGDDRLELRPAGRAGTAAVGPAVGVRRRLRGRRGHRGLLRCAHSGRADRRPARDAGGQVHPETPAEGRRPAPLLAAGNHAPVRPGPAAEIGEQATTGKRHFDWICGLARLAGAWDGRQPEMFTRMSSERDNLWAALDFCSRQPGELAAARGGRAASDGVLGVPRAVR